MAYLKTNSSNKLCVISENADGSETEYPVLKGWESFTGWYWFSIEEAYTQDSIIEDQEYLNDQIHFGLVQGQEHELGYFSEAELNIMCKGLKVWPIKECDLPSSGRRP